MDIICENCQSKFKIPDEKIPQGKTATLPCPKCKNKIAIKAPEPIAPAAGDEADSVAAEFDFEEDGDGYDASDKPFDFIEEEGNIALVCESDAVIREGVQSIVNPLDLYSIELALQLKKSQDCEVVAITMGPQKAKLALKTLAGLLRLLDSKDSGKANRIENYIGECRALM